MPHFSRDSAIEYDPVASRELHRISVIYSIDRAAAVSTEFGFDYVDSGGSITEYLELDRLSPHYEFGENQFPRVLHREEIGGSRLELGVKSSAEAMWARLWLFALPHGSLVATVTFEVRCELMDCISVLEALHHRRYTIDGDEPWAAVCKLAPPDTSGELDRCTVGSEVHQILFPSAASLPELIVDGSGAPQRSTIDSLIYRYRSSYREGDSRIRYPAEANRGHDTLAATGPYVAIVAGHQGYIENAFFISAVQMVGAAALLRRIRVEAYDELLRLRRITGVDRRNIGRMRTQLAVMTERLGHLELELTFGVEANENMASLVPSLRVIDYHRAIFTAADMPQEADTIATMLDRLGRTIRYELEVVRAAERVSDERRRLTVTVAAGFLSVVAVPLGIIFGFFGVGTRDVDPMSSVFNVGRYPGLYGMIFGIAIGASLLAVIMYLGFRRADAAAERDRAAVERMERP